MGDHVARRRHAALRRAAAARRRPARASCPSDYSLNQLAYLYAFQQNDFNGSAAISLMLLVVALGLSTVFVFRGGLFERD